MKKAMLASMEMAPAITAVMVMVRVSRCFNMAQLMRQHARQLFLASPGSSSRW